MMQTSPHLLTLMLVSVIVLMWPTTSKPLKKEQMPPQKKFTPYKNPATPKEFMTTKGFKNLLRYLQRSVIIENKENIATVGINPSAIKRYIQTPIEIEFLLYGLGKYTKPEDVTTALQSYAEKLKADFSVAETQEKKEHIKELSYFLMHNGRLSAEDRSIFYSLYYSPLFYVE
jgi:hypothetical protein